MLVAAAIRSSAVNAIDLCALGANVLTIRDGNSRHCLVLTGGEALRIDLVSGVLDDGPVELEFRLRTTPRLATQIEAILRSQAMLRGQISVRSSVERRRCQAMAASIRIMDAIACGASLRMIGAVLRPSPIEDPWPGQGEHAKSWVRRQVAAATALAAAGHAAILSTR